MTSLWLIPDTPGCPCAHLVDSFGKTILKWRDREWFLARTKKDNFCLNSEMPSLHLRLHDFALKHGLMSREGKTFTACVDFIVIVGPIREADREDRVRLAADRLRMD